MQAVGGLRNVPMSRGLDGVWFRAAVTSAPIIKWRVVHGSGYISAKYKMAAATCAYSVVRA
eukprot:scaffold5009_cov103-Isochrysis_galbana.AAC.2